MKKFCLKLVARLCLVTVLILVFSCDNVSRVEEDEQLSALAPRIKEFKYDASAKIAIPEQLLTFTDLSLGVDSRKWTFEGGEPNVTNDILVRVTFKEVGQKNCTLTTYFFDGTTQVEEFVISVISPSERSTLWDPEVHGFELNYAQNLWNTWDSKRINPVDKTIGAEWAEGTLTVVDGGANGTAKAGKVIYNGEAANGGYFGMTTRDMRMSNAVINKAKRYKLSFWVKADNPGSIAYVRCVNLIEDWMVSSNPLFEDITTLQAWFGAGKYTIPVTTEWVKHEHPFTVSIMPDSGITETQYPVSLYTRDYAVGQNAFPEIGFSGAANVFYIDELELQQLPD